MVVTRFLGTNEMRMLRSFCAGASKAHNLAMLSRVSTRAPVFFYSFYSRVGTAMDKKTPSIGSLYFLPFAPTTMMHGWNANNHNQCIISRGFAKKKGGKAGKQGAAAGPDGRDGDTAAPKAAEGADLEQVDQKMGRYIQALDKDLRTLRAGRADPAMFDHLQVDAYGQSAPLSAVADVAPRGPQLLVVNVYDPQLKGAVDTAIRECGMGLNPQALEGGALSVPVPKTSKEKREKLARMAKQQGEKTKQNVRNARRSAIDETKKAGLPEDESKRLVKEIDALCDAKLKAVSDLIDGKQKELLNASSS